MPHCCERRRHQAMARYLAGDNIEDICRDRGCSKSWLYKWRDRYRAGDPRWAQEGSRRPRTSPAKLPSALEEAIVHLRQVLLPRGAGTVSASAIRQALKDQAMEPVPSLRTLSRVLQRHDKALDAATQRHRLVGHQDRRMR